jgi:hypothetical protein
LRGRTFRTRWKGDWSFIYNLDDHYRQFVTQRLPLVDETALRRRGFTEIARTVEADGSVAFAVQAPVFEPRFVTAVVESAGCDAHVSVQLDPRLSYLPRPAPLGAARLWALPVARFDRVALMVAPGDCAGRAWVFAGPEGQPLPYGDRVRIRVTELHRGLLTARKSRGGDELYDLRSDPAMVANLLERPEFRGRAEMLLKTLRRAYQKGAESKAEWSHTERDSELLRSLGYIQ